MTFSSFLETFVPLVQNKSRQVNRAVWILETTGSEDAAILKAELETELRMLFNDKETFEQLLKWDTEDLNPLLKRQLNVLIRSFIPNQIPKDLLEKITKMESHIAYLYSNFRPKIQGKPVTENEIRDILKKETDVQKRKEAWEASKAIGKELAPSILELVDLRNQAAKSLGYDNYFSMQLALQEVDEKWLFETLDALAHESDASYTKVLKEIEKRALEKFKTNELGPWAWAEPFCQEDPMDAKELDQLTEGVDLIESSRLFYQAMKLPADDILENSDNFERPGKNQHAFCINIDREKDVRTLNNVKSTCKWQETVLHELGHGVYELGMDSTLPWLLREPPHMITTEAIALIAGRQAYRPKSLSFLSPNSSKELQAKAETSLKRRQLIFSRWVLVMTYFERELYRNPHQDLNALWWKTVEKYQKIHSSGSPFKCDWAAKYHIAVAPVYYFSYLLGELFASSLEEQIDLFPSEKTGKFLDEKVFKPGNSLNWNELIKHATGKKLDAKSWLKQFSSETL